MAGWRVWAELRRRDHVDLAWAFLGGHRGRIEQLSNGRRRIVLDARLTRLDRRAVLAHELVHDERGIFFTNATPLALIAKEEAYVIAETVRRLVPTDELAARTRRAVADGCSVDWRDVAEWFGVPREVAERALLRLAGDPMFRRMRE